VVILVYGGYQIATGTMTAIDLATYALYVSLFTTPIETLINFTEMFQKAYAGFKRLREILETDPDVVDAPGAKPLVVTEGDISYNDVWFAYEGDEPVLRGLDLHVEPGKTYALVGPSGAGKSTTCALLPRFYDVDKGSIVIDGQDVSKVQVESLRQAIGIVQQDVYLFDGTIGENIAYGKPGATRDEIVEAAKAANIHDFIQTLPAGYDTPVGERGSHLSGGQKQRIAIARVFLKNPAILVLDEATSALDNESEFAVQESLARLSSGRTTLIIAHRLSTIRDADRIVTMENGQVSEIGTHDELLARNGTYARYYRMQFEGRR
jgi:ATP-binding cassette subfamily B protein